MNVPSAGGPVPRPLPQPPPTPVPAEERDFVVDALADPKFGTKNAFILNRYWGYELPGNPAPPPSTPPPPKPVATVPPDQSLLSKAHTFEAMEQAAQAGPQTSVLLPGMVRPVPVYGARPEELNHIVHALEAIPEHARGELAGLERISVGETEVFMGSDGSLSQWTTGVCDEGHLLLNRHQLNWFQSQTNDDAARKHDAENWFNCISHELGHICDHSLAEPSVAADSPLGHGVWYTNYSWQTQDPREDMAEGFALLSRKHWGLTHPNDAP